MPVPHCSVLCRAAHPHLAVFGVSPDDHLPMGDCVPLDANSTNPFKNCQLGSRQNRFAAVDRPALKPLPSSPYQFAEWHRHHAEGIEAVRQKLGDEAALTAEIHIVVDSWGFPVQPIMKTGHVNKFGFTQESTADDVGRHLQCIVQQNKKMNLNTQQFPVFCFKFRGVEKIL